MEIHATALEDVEDRDLVRRARDKDLAAYDELVRRYHGKLYGVLYNMTGNKEDAEDMIQEVFITAYKALPRFEGKASFYTWLYRIAVNRTINFLKKRKNRATLSLEEMDTAVERDEAYVERMARDNPFRDATLTELQEKLNKAIMALSENHRAVVVLHDIEGVPHEEIGKMLGCSSGTIRSRLFYARRELQSLLSEFAP